MNNKKNSLHAIVYSISLFNLNYKYITLKRINSTVFFNYFYARKAFSVLCLSALFYFKKFSNIRQ